MVMTMKRRKRERRAARVPWEALPSSVLFLCIWVASYETDGRSPHQNPRSPDF